ncbi:MAG: hypothetical protein K2N51_05510 [Lachnospiraceae bacterium]|nr:hypothetical protein [Lachnospiraceae bacterium]
MKVKIKGVLALYICLSLILGLIYCEDTFVHTIVKAQETTNNTVYFGNYIQEEVTDEEELEAIKQYEFKDNKLYVDDCHYVYKNRKYYKDTPIQWRILKDEGNSYLLMSEKILENRQLSSWLIECWEDAELRTWLNSEFIEYAFGDAKEDLIETNIASRHVDWDTHNMSGNTSGYGLVYTKDKVWLLDEDEVVDTSYGFKDNSSRIAYASSYVDQNETAQMWFLRGHPYFFYGLAHMKTVETTGEIHKQGGVRDHENAASMAHGIRPVIRVKKDSKYLSFTKPIEKSINTTFTDGSLDWNKQVANLFSTSSLGSFDLIGPEIQLGKESFNIFKCDAEFKSPFLFDNTDINVKYNAAENSLQVLVGYDRKWKNELDKAEVLSKEWKDNWKRTKSIVLGAEKDKLKFEYEQPDKSFLDSYKETKEKLKENRTSFVFETGFKVLGYFEIELDENHKISKLLDGGVLFDGEIGMKGRSYIWTIIYSEASLGSELSAKIHAQYDGEKIEPKGDIELKLKASIALGANAIVVDAQGGLKGTISGKASFPYKSKRDSLGLGLDGSLFFKVNSIIGLKGEYSYKFANVELYPELKVNGNNVKLSYKPAQIYTKKDVKNIDSSDKIDTNVMDSIVSDFARPQTIKLNDGTVLLTYLSDQEEGAEGQNTLMYRTNRDGVWSDAMPVYQTNRMDTMAKLFEYKGKIYAIYQNSTEALSEDMTVEEISKSMQIYVAEYNESASRFKKPILVGKENDYYKYNYLLCEKDGKLCAMWAENTANDCLLQSGETKRVGCVLSDSDWGEVEQYGSGKEVYDQFVYFTYNDIERKIVVSNEGKEMSINDRTYRASDTIQDMQVVGNRVYYRKMKENILCYFDLDTSKFSNTGIQVGSNYLIKENGVYWTEQDGLKNNIVYQLWEADSVPVQITDEDGYISDFQMITIDDKETLIYTLQKVDEDAENLYGATVMKSKSDFNQNRIQINSVSYDVLEYVPGEENAFAIEFVNVGNTDLHNVTLTVKDENGTQLLQEKIYNELKVGSLLEHELGITVPSLLNKGELIFEITADETLSEKAVYKKVIENSDADITIQKQNDDSVKITNIASKTATDVYINVYDKNIGETLIKSYPIGNIESGMNSILDISKCYALATLDSETNEKMLYCEVTQADMEFNIGDNVVVLYKKAEADNNEKNPVTTQTPIPLQTTKPISLPTVKPTEKLPTVAKPKKVSVTKAKASGKGNVKVTWKKVSKAKGYQIAYARNKKFNNQKLKNTKKRTYIIKKLKKKKIYYIRVRAYTVANGKKKYGSWSKIKKVKVK